MELTPKNYHSPEADAEYMSSHQWREWITCPSRAKARLDGRYVEEPSEALLIGSYVDCMLLTPDDVPAFEAEHAAELFSRPTKDRLAAAGLVSGKATIDDVLQQHPEAAVLGEPRAGAQMARSCADRVRRDPGMMAALEGERQVIVKAQLGGVWWKCMVDVLRRAELRIVDLKTTASLARSDWTSGATIFHALALRDGRDPGVRSLRAPWYEVYHYWGQAAIYRAAVLSVYGDLCDFMLAAVSKQKPPDVDMYLMADQSRLDTELQMIEAWLPQVVRWKSGEDDAPHCWQEVDEDCPWCRGEKVARLLEARSVM